MESLIKDQQIHINQLVICILKQIKNKTKKYLIWWWRNKQIDIITSALTQQAQTICLCSCHIVTLSTTFTIRLFRAIFVDGKQSWTASEWQDWTRTPGVNNMELL